MFLLLKKVLELTFGDVLEYARRIIFNRRFVIESLSFEWLKEFWEHSKVAGSYDRTVQSGLSPKIAAQDSINALVRYRGEDASHRTHVSHS